MKWDRTKQSVAETTRRTLLEHGAYPDPWPWPSCPTRYLRPEAGFFPYAITPLDVFAAVLVQRDGFTPQRPVAYIRSCYGGPMAPIDRDPTFWWVLSVATCGLGGLVWQHRTIRELSAMGDPRPLNPVAENALSLLLPGYFYFAAYKISSRVGRALERGGSPRTADGAIADVVLALLCGVHILKLQVELNRAREAAGTIGTLHGRPETF